MALKFFAALFSSPVLRLHDLAVADELHVALENAGQDHLHRIAR